MATVITYQAPGGRSIHLTPAQVRMLEAAGTWPRDHRGQEYCHVSHGAHDWEPTWTDDELRKECGIEGITVVEMDDARDTAVTADNSRILTSADRAAYDWAVREQGFTGSYADWQALSPSERRRYEDGAQGIGTV